MKTTTRVGTGSGHARRYCPPVATYRVQLHAGFPFAAARALVPYFAALGVSHLYCSPFFTAVPGSLHGYDVLDHNQVNPELGGLAALYELSEALTEREMGLIADIVPNHVGLASGANPWWRDVLRYGRASRYAGYFDINWEAQPHLPSGVLVFPILGQPFGAALEAGELQLDLVDDDLAVRYYDRTLPLAPRGYPTVIGLPPLESRSQFHDPAAFAEFVALLEALPVATPEEAAPLLERFRALLATEPALAAHVRASLARFNGTPGDPASFDALERLLSAQHYRLAYWRVSGEEINYRRFFDINELAGIRVEREEVFEETHRLLFELVGRGIVTGLRIDHVDGLYDPQAYLARLRQRLREVTDREIPIYVEKILEAGEELPPDWPVAGTTGYNFLAHADGVLVDRAGSRELTQTYERFLGPGAPVRFHEIVYTAKREIARTAFAGEVNVLAIELHRLAQRHRLYRDETLTALRRALETVLACFPVYRTYLSGDRPGEWDRAIIARAVDEARRRNPELTVGALDFLARVLCLDYAESLADERAQWIHFRRRFQQISGPVMAKGSEDTAFYRYNRLISLNEVGNDPARFGIAPREAHDWFAARVRAWPLALSASSTHDTKRGEDTRARLHVLSEAPGRWRSEVRAWSRLNARYRTALHGETVPDPNTEYLLYQTLVGSWPYELALPDDEYRARLRDYLTKALREAKRYTSWTKPDERYEAACQEFLTALLDPARSGPFLERLVAFVRWIAPAGALNSLSALLLKALAPGIPDFYQGSELWTLTLTDPDNRRPVDFTLRERLLARLGEAPPDALTDPALKLWLTHRLLQVRAARQELLNEGDYRPLAVRGPRATSLFAFARWRGEELLVALVPRLPMRLLGPDGAWPVAESWAGTTTALPANAGWRDELLGRELTLAGRVPVPALLGDLPFAVLTGHATPARRAASRRRRTKEDKTP